MYELGTYKFVKQPNQHTGKIRSLKLRIVNWVRWFISEVIRFVKLSLGVSIAMAVGAILTGVYMGSHTTTVNADNSFFTKVSFETRDSLDKKIEQMKGDIANEIARLENPKMIPAVYDDNSKKSLSQKDKVSYGCMQMKISTIQMFYTQLGKGKISDLDAALLAMDCDKAKEFAIEAIFGIQGAIWHWTTATKEMGSKVEFIKQLQK